MSSVELIISPVPHIPTDTIEAIHIINATNLKSVE